MAHADLEAMDVKALWLEYTGPTGKEGLRQREKDIPDWRKDNMQSCQLFADKMFIYREIARQAESLGNIEAALTATQARLDNYASKRYRGWGKLLKALQMEQPKGEVRNRLSERLAQI